MEWWKDAALALETINHEQTYEVVALLTTIEAENGRTISHGVHKDLILAQGNTLGLPVDFVPMPIHATNQVYEKRMTNTLLKYQTKGIETVIFGDLFLEDLRAYRENQLASIGMNAYFPLWRQSETQLINYFLNKNYRALTVCVDGTVLSKSYVGKKWMHNFFITSSAYKCL